MASLWKRATQRRHLRQRRLPQAEFAEFLKKVSTPHEQILWLALQNRRCDGILFDQQVPVLHWIADFLAPDLKLIIEVDGKNHFYGRQKRKDIIRDKLLATEGFTVLRVTNDEVLHELTAVVSTIKRVASELKNRTTVPISNNSMERPKKQVPS